MRTEKSVRIRVVYDNRARPPLRNGWGFSALIEGHGRVILFDCGADRLVLAHNLRELGIDPGELTDLFISHPHCDHVGGLSHILERARGLTIWAPWVMEDYLRPRIRGTKAKLILIRGPRRLEEGFWTTGTMGRRVKEQGLLVATSGGGVLITGCAHPGVARMAARAARLWGGKLRLVLGGFHLAGLPTEKVTGVIRDLEGVTGSVAPGHCTGDEPTSRLIARFPESVRLEAGATFAFG